MSEVLEGYEGMIEGRKKAEDSADKLKDDLFVEMTDRAKEIDKELYEVETLIGKQELKILRLKKKNKRLRKI